MRLLAIVIALALAACVASPYPVPSGAAVNQAGDGAAGGASQ